MSRTAPNSAALPLRWALRRQPAAPTAEHAHALTRVLMALAFHAQASVVTAPAMQFLVAHTGGMNRSTIRTSLHELERQGFIRRRGRQGQVIRWELNINDMAGDHANTKRGTVLAR